MTVEQRSRRCILLEKMRQNEEFAKKLGLKDVSIFRGKRVNDKGGID